MNINQLAQQATYDQSMQFFSRSSAYLKPQKAYLQLGAERSI